MAKATISMDDALFTHVREAAGEHLSEWIAKACRDRLLSEGVRAAIVWEREHPAEAAAARREEALWQLETEAEREVQDLAEEAWAARGGQGDGPTAQDRADAERRVRTLFERADHRLRKQQQPRDGQ
ncbi:hypothetical protein [Nocardia cyriacigeorgica]|uniref:hypothetical protein n=1 Tax=Nocardia cyriacigeorgica TaxID=135487 RepID=UPI0018934198|nr:hypothetical protein [Nocardia cyriacigeorgica]MBF6289895.1 hypothetical protein [Nocardia cyriacigeorgica]